MCVLVVSLVLPIGWMAAAVGSWKCGGVLTRTCVTALATSVLALNFLVLCECHAVSKFKGLFSSLPQLQPLLVPDLQIC